MNTVAGMTPTTLRQSPRGTPRTYKPCGLRHHTPGSPVQFTVGLQKLRGTVVSHDPTRRTMVVKTQQREQDIFMSCGHVAPQK